jgi:hypothetical protein
MCFCSCTAWRQCCTLCLLEREGKSVLRRQAGRNKARVHLSTLTGVRQIALNAVAFTLAPWFFSVKTRSREENHKG